MHTSDPAIAAEVAVADPVAEVAVADPVAEAAVADPVVAAAVADPVVAAAMADPVVAAAMADPVVAAAMADPVVAAAMADPVQRSLLLQSNLLQIQAAKLQVDIEAAMNDVEVMCQKYADIMNRLHGMNALSGEQMLTHGDIMDRLTGGSKKNGVPPRAVDAGGALDEIIASVAKSQAPNSIPADITMEGFVEATDLAMGMGDNDEIWERIAAAHTAALAR